MITLGIIGIVAALTMPMLVASYKTRVFETRFKKFYAVLAQVINSNKAETGADIPSALDLADAHNPDKAMDFFNEYFAPYMKTVKVEKLNNGVSAALPDGSGIYLRLLASNSIADPRLAFCMYYKDCKASALDVDKSGGAQSGQQRLDAVPPAAFPFPINNLYAHSETRANKVRYCDDCVNNGNSYYCVWCSYLLYDDGFEIKDDNPIKF